MTIQPIPMIWADQQLPFGVGAGIKCSQERLVSTPSRLQITIDHECKWGLDGRLDQVPGIIRQKSSGLFLSSSGAPRCNAWWKSLMGSYTIICPLSSPLAGYLKTGITFCDKKNSFFRFFGATAACLFLKYIKLSCHCKLPAMDMMYIWVQTWTCVSGDAECQFISMWWKVFWQILPGQEFWPVRKW